MGYCRSHLGDRCGKAHFQLSASGGAPRVLLQITTDDGAAMEVAIFEKDTERPEDLGLSIAEGKALMVAVQRQVFDAQVAPGAERPRCCEACGTI
jgi:hypothetical protein